MAQSKITKEDAQEWLETLQLSGEGWYRSLALAIKANAHKALGLDRKEFAALVGQRLVDPTDAILELYEEDHNQQHIADVLGIAPWTVARVLAEQGLIDMPAHVARRLGLDDEVGDSGQGGDDEVGDSPVEDLIAKIDALEVKVKGEEAKRKREVKEVKDKLAKQRKEARDELRRQRLIWEGNQSQADRERAMKEAEAWAAEQGEKLLQGLAHLGVQSIVGDLGDVAEQLRLLNEEHALGPEGVAQIDAALAGVNEELNVARAMASSITN